VTRRRLWRATVTDGGGVILLDGDRLMPGCVCTSGCEFPCWQRVGIDDEPCCAGCAPLGGEAAAYLTLGRLR